MLPAPVNPVSCQQGVDDAVDSLCVVRTILYVTHVHVQMEVYWLAQLLTDHRPTFSSPVCGGAHLNGIWALGPDLNSYISAASSSRKSFQVFCQVAWILMWQEMTTRRSWGGTGPTPCQMAPILLRKWQHDAGSHCRKWAETNKTKMCAALCRREPRNPVFLKRCCSSPCRAWL